MKNFLIIVLLFLSAKSFSQTDSTARSEAEAKDKVEKIFERLNKGEDFGALAIQYSEDKGSAKSGGDLGWTNRGSLVLPFEEAAFNLQPGQISPPVKSEFGFHIIQLLAKNENSIHTRHILIRFSN